MAKRMTVHEVVEAVGASPTTFRKSERTGVLEPAPRDRNGWRVYTPDQFEKVSRGIYPSGDGAWISMKRSTRKRAPGPPAAARDVRRPEAGQRLWIVPDNS
jgi:hypothetical protein